MECEKLRQQLDLVPAPDAPEPEFADAVEHVKDCGPCRDKLARRLESERAIRLTMESMAPLPETLVASVIGATRRTEPRWRRARVWLAAASVLLVLGAPILGGYWREYRLGQAVERLCALSIKNHEVYASPEFASDDARRVSQWLSERLHRLVRPPEGLRLVSVAGGRRCALGEQAVGVFHFEIDGHRSTLFSFYPDEFDVENVRQPPKLDMGYTVAVWTENGMGYSLVSEAPVDKVEPLFGT